MLIYSDYYKIFMDLKEFKYVYFLPSNTGVFNDKSYGQEKFRSTGTGF